VPASQQTVVEVVNGGAIVKSRSTPVAVGKTYTEIVIGTGTPGDYSGVQDFFFSSLS
jgi:hypothetical protein